MKAEVEIGQGNQAVYGWYFPAYRELAELKGEGRWPIKVGRTERDPQVRMTESGGTFPERPIPVFVLRVDDASRWERLLHNILSLRGQHIDEAIGQEWFNTNPDELRQLVAKLSNITTEGKTDAVKEGM